MKRKSASGLAVLVALTLVACSSGCKDNDRAIAGPRSASTGKIPVQGKKIRPINTDVDDEEARHFGESLEKVVAAGDTQATIGLIDIEALCDLATDIPGCLIPARQKAASDLRDQLLGRYKTFQPVIDDVSRGGSFRLLRIHSDGGRKRALFRYIAADSFLNYFDAILVKGRDNKVRLQDFYRFDACSFASQRMRESLYLYAANDAKECPLLGEAEREFARSEYKISRMIEACKAEKAQEAVEIFRGLPELVKSNKEVQIKRLDAFRRLGNAEFDEAIRDFRRRFPDESGVEVAMFNAHTLRKEYPSALACVDRLDNFVGGDSYLDYIRVYIRFQAGDLKTARADASRSIERDDSFRDPHLLLIAISLQEKSFDETLHLLRETEKKFPKAVEDIDESPSFADFVDSPQYREWENAHLGKEKRGGEPPRPNAPIP